MYALEAERHWCEASLEECSSRDEMTMEGCEGVNSQTVIFAQVQYILIHQEGFRSYSESNFSMSAWEYEAPTTFFGSGGFEEFEEFERQKGEPELSI